MVITCTYSDHAHTYNNAYTNRRHWRAPVQVLAEAAQIFDKPYSSGTDGADTTPRATCEA